MERTPSSEADSHSTSQPAIGHGALMTSQPRK